MGNLPQFQSKTCITTLFGAASGGAFTASAQMNGSLPLKCSFLENGSPLF